MMYGKKQFCIELKMTYVESIEIINSDLNLEWKNALADSNVTIQLCTLFECYCFNNEQNMQFEWKLN